MPPTRERPKPPLSDPADQVFTRSNLKGEGAPRRSLQGGYDVHGRRHRRPVQRLDKLCTPVYQSLQRNLTPPTTRIHAARAAMSARPHPSRAIRPRSTRLPPPGPPPCIQTVLESSKEQALASANPNHRQKLQRPSRLRTPSQQPTSTRLGKWEGRSGPRPRPATGGSTSSKPPSYRPSHPKHSASPHHGDWHQLARGH